MPDETNSASSTKDSLSNLSLYQIYRAQLEEIMKHKWIESEKAGHDIGFEQALTDWEFKHRTTWFKQHDVPQHHQA